MSGPWEQYSSPAGPWSKYSTKSEPIKMGQDSFADDLKAELENAGWAGRNLAGVGSAVQTGWEGLKGLVGQSDQRNIDAQKVIADAAPVGNIVGNVAMLAPTALIPGANTVTGAATIGALQGALLTPGDIKERAKAAAVGGVGGAVGAKISNAISKSSPSVINQDAKLLMDEGVYLTPGQNAGGLLKSIEDKAT